MPHGRFVDKVLEEGSSATCSFSKLHLLLWGMTGMFHLHADHKHLPVRIFRAAEARMLDSALDFQGFTLWISAYTRSSSRAVDMVLSIMDLFGVNLDVGQFGQDDRTKATIAMLRALMADPRATATWLYVAPRMTPSKELSTLPQMPETSESGRAYIHTTKGRVLAFEAIGRGANIWRTDGAPRGEMTNSGYFIFWGKAALLVYEDKDERRSPLLPKGYDDRETWAIVVGRFENLNRNPVTWKIQGYNSATSAKPEGLYELTLMLVERHGYGLYHRVGMEREIDERKVAG
ncbi:uncharacterized protein PHACADRAFT_266181, partial [Phanerochaete carnosa HHB-10118-sp]